MPYRTKGYFRPHRLNSEARCDNLAVEPAESILWEVLILNFDFSPLQYLLQNQLLCEIWWGERDLQARDKTNLQKPFN